MTAQRWRPSYTPIQPFRSEMTPERVQQLAQTGTDRVSILRWAIRSYDLALPANGRQAIYQAIRTPMSADDAAAENRVSATWVKNQLEKRARYYATRIAPILGITPKRAAAIAYEDLVPDDSPLIRIT